MKTGGTGEIEQVLGDTGEIHSVFTEITVFSPEKRRGLLRMRISCVQGFTGFSADFMQPGNTQVFSAGCTGALQALGVTPVVTCEFGRVQLLSVTQPEMGP